MIRQDRQSGIYGSYTHALIGTTYSSEGDELSNGTPAVDLTNTTVRNTTAETEVTDYDALSGLMPDRTNVDALDPQVSGSIDKAEDGTVMTAAMVEVISEEINYRDVADYFLALANETGESLTNLKLQKLIYYVQAWYLANYNVPLFRAEFEPWIHGPVIPNLYREMKAFGSNPITLTLELEEVEKRFDDDTLEFLREIADVYMPYGAYAMEKMVHREQPWIQARGNLATDERCKAIISEESMRTFYAQRLKAEEREDED